MCDRYTFFWPKSGPSPPVTTGGGVGGPCRTLWGSSRISRTQHWKLLKHSQSLYHIIIQLPFSAKSLTRKWRDARASLVSKCSDPAPPRPGGVTGQYLGRDVHLGNRRVFRVSSKTHFPWSVLKGKTGFRLLSSRNDQRRRRHGPEDPILIFQKNHQLPTKSQS